MAEKCWGGRLCCEWMGFFHTWKSARWSVCCSGSCLVQKRPTVLLSLFLLYLHGGSHCFAAFQVWEHSDLLFSHSNMSSLVQPLFVCVYSMFRWHNSCCMQQTESHSWQLGQNKTQFRPSNRPVCVWNELLFIENVTNLSLCHRQCVNVEQN